MFVSHAALDHEYVAGFVDNVLIRGGGLSSDSIFYSSGDDTGVRSGRDLMAEVRAEAGGTDLLIAMVTPTFQTRPVCIAELGAAWARNILFPLMSPDMDRSELEGVLPGLAIRSADDKAALNELADRLRSVGFEISVSTWGTGLEKWLSFLRKNPDVVKAATVLTPKQVDVLRDDLEAARSALDEEEERSADLARQVEELKSAKSAEDVRRITLPREESHRFEALRTSAEEALGAVAPIVAEAIWFELVESGMPYPNYMEEPDRSREAEEARHEGTLVENSSELLAANPEFPKIAAAVNAVHELIDFLAEPSEDFEDWFRDEYEVPMDLTKRACWRALLT